MKQSTRGNRIWSTCVYRAEFYKLEATSELAGLGTVERTPSPPKPCAVEIVAFLVVILYAWKRNRTVSEQLPQKKKKKKGEQMGTRKEKAVSLQ
jgi:hypothetical protein